MSITLEEQAIEVLQNNDQGEYSVPTVGLYPYQWNWDSVFCALGYASFNLDRAWQELESLLEGQWSNGMVPHIVFRHHDESYFPGPKVWQSPTLIPTSCYSQPPVLGTVLRWLVEKEKQPTERSRAIFQKTLSWHRWWYAHRLDPKTGLIYIVHPWESGRDNSSAWDEAMAAVEINSDLENYQRRDTVYVDQSQRPHKIDYDRYLSILKFSKDHGWEDRLECLKDAPIPFCMADDGINFILLRSNRDLLGLAQFFSSDETEIQEIKSWIDCSRVAIEHLWNQKTNAYAVMNLKTGQLSNAVTSASFLAFYAGLEQNRFQSKLILHLRKVKSKTTYGIPSLRFDDSSFDPKCYWRGPIWVVINFLIATGLEESGHLEESFHLRLQTAQLIDQSGFREYFHPLTGEGLGGKDFSWTAAIWLAWNLQELI